MTIRETAQVLELPVVENEVRFQSLAEADAFRALCDRPWAVPKITYDFDAREYCVYLKEE